jgi:hypothetical protein
LEEENRAPEGRDKQIAHPFFSIRKPTLKEIVSKYSNRHTKSKSTLSSDECSRLDSALLYNHTPPPHIAEKVNGLFNAMSYASLQTRDKISCRFDAQRAIVILCNKRSLASTQGAEGRN